MSTRKDDGCFCCHLRMNAEIMPRFRIETTRVDKNIGFSNLCTSLHANVTMCLHYSSAEDVCG
jgi:hypothetical protein